MTKSQFRKRKPKPKATKAIDKMQDRRIRKLEKKMADVFELVNTDDLTNVKTLNATPQVFFMSVTGGAGQSQHLNSLRIKGWVKANLTSALQDDYRIDFIVDKLPTATPVTPLEIYESATPTQYALIDFEKRKRFRILKSITGIFNSGGDVVTQRTFDHTIKLNFNQENESSGFNQSAITKNALYWILWTTASANQPTCEFAYRVVLRGLA